jgi:methionyl-tRNA synthetase
MSDIATGQDADFSEERLIERYNANLANSLGNLLNRTLSMADKYRAGLIKTDADYKTQFDMFMRLEQLPTDAKGLLKKPDYLPLLDHAASVVNAIGGFEQAMNEFLIHSALNASIGVAERCNILVERTSPWKLSKQKENAQQLDAVLYHLAESLRIIAILISPVLPKAAHGIFDQLNWKTEPQLSGKEERFSLAEAEWGKLPDGHVVGKPTPLFPRVEVDEGV